MHILPFFIIFFFLHFRGKCCLNQQTRVIGPKQLHACRKRSDVSVLLDRQVVCSRSAACAAGFAESPLVLLAESPTRAQQKPVGAPVLDVWTSGLPASSAEAVLVVPEVGVLGDLTALLPPVGVAAHLEEGRLLHGGGYFVLLGGQVLRVLLVSQVVVGESYR